MPQPETITVQTTNLSCDGGSRKVIATQGLTGGLTSRPVPVEDRGAASQSLNCDEGDLGHPRVYLTMKDGAVDCPYCGRHFVLAATVKKATGH